MMEIRKEVLGFAVAMELVLKFNDNRISWKEMNISYLHGNLENNIKHLGATLEGDTNGLKHCIDIANYAMMIYDNILHYKEKVHYEKEQE